MLELFTVTFTDTIHQEVTIESTMTLLKSSLLQFAKIVAPMMAIAAVAAIAANLLQVGVLFTSEPLKLDVKKSIQSRVLNGFFQCALWLNY